MANNALHLTGVSLRFTPAGEFRVICNAIESKKGLLDEENYFHLFKV